MKKKLSSIDLMILATFITTITYSSTYPFIHKQLMMVVSEKLVALTNILDCVGIIIADRIWQANGKKLYKSYILFCVLECVTTIATTTYCLLSKDLISYYIIDTVAFAVMTRNVICGGRRLRALRYKDEESRVNYENNNSTVASIATLIGSGISMLLGLPFEVMIIIATIGNCIDNIFYIKIFMETDNDDSCEE